ncbi:hypothetical protein FGO68_gene9384 [Halteria grandinella]|uniref:Uncharacterized protein n=1 Tax=Halteria grandinella TaxID=5974 RepID=A0A8J8NMA4_HALGN|nr:hypothetical protein FGO68_gene9384 [Halteria grandinella]
MENNTNVEVRLSTIINQDKEELGSSLFSKTLLKANFISKKVLKSMPVNKIVDTYLCEVDLTPDAKIDQGALYEVSVNLTSKRNQPKRGWLFDGMKLVPVQDGDTEAIEQYDNIEEREQAQELQNLQDLVLLRQTGQAHTIRWQPAATQIIRPTANQAIRPVQNQGFLDRLFGRNK